MGIIVLDWIIGLFSNIFSFIKGEVEDSETIGKIFWGFLTLAFSGIILCICGLYVYWWFLSWKGAMIFTSIIVGITLLIQICHGISEWIAKH